MGCLCSVLGVTAVPLLDVRFGCWASTGGRRVTFNFASLGGAYLEYSHVVNLPCPVLPRKKSGQRHISGVKCGRWLISVASDFRFHLMAQQGTSPEKRDFGLHPWLEAAFLWAVQVALGAHFRGSLRSGK